MALELLLLRHGEAAFTLPDSQRALTERGIARTRQVIGRRRTELSRAQSVYVSPYVRARQSLALIEDELSLPQAQTYPGLVPESNVDALIDWLEPQQGVVLLVAHNPLLSLLLNRLLGESNRYGFDTSTLACLSMPVAASGCAELDWLEHADR